MITTMTPTSENFRGTSALPYHLMVERDESIEIEIYTFNNNDVSTEKMRRVEKELNVSIKAVPLPRWFACLFKLTAAVDGVNNRRAYNVRAAEKTDGFVEYRNYPVGMAALVNFKARISEQIGRILETQMP